MLSLPDDAFIVTIRLLIAAIFSGLIGMEREIKGHPAGFRTHLLVGIGACLMMLLSNYGFSDFLAAHENARMDPARLPSYVVSGIGFLGAGTILVHGATVKGLTTAASIWVVAGIGLVVGNGMYFAAILVTIVVIFSLFLLNRLSNILGKKTETEYLNIVVENKQLSLSQVVSMVEEQNIIVKEVTVEDYPDNRERNLVKYVLLVRIHGKGIPPQIYDRLYQTEHMYKVYTAG